MSKNDLTYIPLKNPIRGGVIDYTHVRVSVYYYKDARPRGIVLSVNGCESQEGFVREALTVGGNFSGIYRVIKPMERGNARAEAAIRDQILAEIEAKSGPYWDEISKVVEAHTQQPVAV